MIRYGASLARAATTSIATRDGLKPTRMIVHTSALTAKASGGVTTATYVVPVRPNRIPP